MTRAFVALRLPDVVLDGIDARVADRAMPGRRTTRDQWHVTLQFLGDDADVDAVAAALEDLEVSSGRVRIGGAGAFPEARRAHVVWLGLEVGIDVATRLAVAVSARTAALGHESDPRPFVPHVTLARLRTAADVRAVVGEIGIEPIGPAWNVDAVTLYESRRFADGARYIARATIPLPV